MKLIIDIPDKEYEDAKSAKIINEDLGFERLGHIYEAIAEGTVVGDASVYLLEDVEVFDKNGTCMGRAMVDNQRHLLFSGYITIEAAEKLGFTWKKKEGSVT